MRYLIGTTKKKNIHIILGFLALLPFFMIASLCIVNKENYVKYLNLAEFYTYIIVCFIGASYWGLAIRLKGNIYKLTIFSVIPAILVTILHFINMNTFINLLSSIFLLNIIFIYEKIILYEFIPDWYLKLRKTLNLIVTSFILVIILITFGY